MIYRIVLFLLVFGWAIEASPQTQVIRTIGPEDPEAGASHQYYIDLLAALLKRTEPQFGPAKIERVPHPGQGPVLNLLAQNRFYDLIWTGASSKRENNLSAIPVPILKGVLGWRGMVIRRQDQMQFDQIQSLAQLRDYIACQGKHWPDADILEEAGLVVTRVSQVTAMMTMLIGQRCDYLPLSLFEGPEEVNARHPGTAELMFYDSLILKYPLSMHFFVHKSNTALAKRLTVGLEQMVQDGALMDFMREHPVSQHMFPLTQYAESRVLELNKTHVVAPDLLDQPKYWLSLP